MPISCPSLERNLATSGTSGTSLLTSLWDTLTACHPGTRPLHRHRPIPLTLLSFTKVLPLLTLSSQWNIIVTVLDGRQNLKSIYPQTCRRILTHFHTDSKSQNLASHFRSTLCVGFESFSVYRLDRFKHFSHLFFQFSSGGVCEFIFFLSATVNCCQSGLLIPFVTDFPSLCLVLQLAQCSAFLHLCVSQMQAGTTWGA